MPESAKSGSVAEVCGARSSLSNTLAEPDTPSLFHKLRSRVQFLRRYKMTGFVLARLTMPTGPERVMFVNGYHVVTLERFVAYSTVYWCPESPEINRVRAFSGLILAVSLE